LYAEWCPKNVIKGIVYNGTKSGWIDEVCFYDYLNTLFIPNTKHLKKPVLLLFDGHASHLGIKSVRLAMDNGIHLLCLPSHATHLLQPLDVYTLKYVKQQWKQLLWNRSKQTTKTMDKRDFIRLFSKLYDDALIPAHCSTAFAKAGIYPFDPRAVKQHRIIRTDLPTADSTSDQANESSPPDAVASLNLISVSTPANAPLTRSNSAPNLNAGKLIRSLNLIVIYFSP
jgi:hypothetical protein